jgi:hypothetical protein
VLIVERQADMQVTKKPEQYEKVVEIFGAIIGQQGPSTMEIVNVVD